MGPAFWPLVTSLNEPAPLDLRVNAFKAKRPDVRMRWDRSMAQQGERDYAGSDARMRS